MLLAKQGCKWNSRRPWLPGGGVPGPPQTEDLQDRWYVRRATCTARSRSGSGTLRGTQAGEAVKCKGTQEEA
jgi:hypothetical protein